jgi:hypothetical protein
MEENAGGDRAGDDGADDKGADDEGAEDGRDEGETLEEEEEADPISSRNSGKRSVSRFLGCWRDIVTNFN